MLLKLELKFLLVAFLSKAIFVLDYQKEKTSRRRFPGGGGKEVALFLLFGLSKILPFCLERLLQPLRFCLGFENLPFRTPEEERAFEEMQRQRREELERRLEKEKIKKLLKKKKINL